MDDADEPDELERMVMNRASRIQVPTSYRNGDGEGLDELTGLHWRPSRDPAGPSKRKRKTAALDSARSLFDLDVPGAFNADVFMDEDERDLDEDESLWNNRRNRRAAQVVRRTSSSAPIWTGGGPVSPSSSLQPPPLRFTVSRNGSSAAAADAPAWMSEQPMPSNATTGVARALRKLGCKKTEDLAKVLTGLRLQPELRNGVLAEFARTAASQLKGWMQQGDIPATPVARMAYLGEVALATEVASLVLASPMAEEHRELRSELKIALRYFSPWFWLRMIDYDNFCSTGDVMPGVMGDMDDADDGAIDTPQSTDPKIVVRCTHAWWLICLQGAAAPCTPAEDDEMVSWEDMVKRRTLKEIAEAARCYIPDSHRHQWSALGAEALVKHGQPGVQGAEPPRPEWLEGRVVADLDLDELSALLWRWSSDWKDLHWGCGMHAELQAIAVQTARLFFTQPAAAFSSEQYQDLPDAAYAERPASFRLVSAVAVARAHLLPFLSLSDAHHALVHAWKQEVAHAPDEDAKVRFYNNLYVLTQSGHVRNELWTIYEKGILAFGASPAAFEYAAQSAGAAVGVGGRTAATALSGILSDDDFSSLCGFLCTTDCAARHVIAEAPILRDTAPDIKKQIPADVITLTDNLSKPMDPQPYRMECLYHLTRILVGMQRSRNSDLERIDRLEQTDEGDAEGEEESRTNAAEPNGSGATAACMWHENDRVLASLPESPDATLWLGPRNRTLETRIYCMLLGTEEEQPEGRHPEGGCTVMWRFMGDFWIASPRTERWARCTTLHAAMHLWLTWCEEDRAVRPCEQCESACDTVQMLFGQIREAE